MHKYGFHVNAVSDPVFDAIVRIKPKVIKTLHHDVGFWRRVRQVHPSAFIIGRLFTPHQDFQSNPEVRGREFAERVLREEVNRIPFEGRPLYNAWESFNEVIPESVSPDVMKAYDAFQVAFAQRIYEAGFEPIAMNFGTGNFLGHHFLDNFQGTLETYRYLGFHEYDWPTMWRLHKESEAKDGGMWLTLRYRRTMTEVRKVYPNRHLVMITECGMTQGVHPQGVGDVGPWHHSHPISGDDYWTSLMWYNDELSKDDYVIGACLFVVGAISPWESFEHLGGIVDRLEQLQLSQPQEIQPAIISTAVDIPAAPVESSQPATVASSTPLGAADVSAADVGAADVGAADVTPDASIDTIDTTMDVASVTPEELGDLEDYVSHYLLFPAGLHWDWYEACRFYFEQFGQTWGVNVRDAARADVITCVNPNSEMLETLGRLNPSAHLDVVHAVSPAELSALVGQRILSGKAYEL